MRFDLILAFAAIAILSSPVLIEALSSREFTRSNRPRQRSPRPHNAASHQP